MIYFQSTNDFALAGPSAVTLGKFDGVHKGHRLLMDCIHRKEKEGCISTAFAIAAGRGPLLMTPAEQKKTIRELGIQVLIRCPFLPEFAKMSPEEFIEKILLERLHAKYVAVGTDYRFGYQRKGDASFLKEYGKSHGFETYVIEKASYCGREISSSYIREELEKGNMQAVNTMLGDPYPVCGIVQHGAHLGSRLGIPTINLVPEGGKLLPPFGVYYSVTELEDRRIPGVTNVGRKPTVGGTYVSVETYLFDFEGDLYGREVCTHLLEWVRPEEKYSGLQNLQHQIQKDIEAGRNYFSGQGIVDGQLADDRARTGDAGSGSDTEGC